MSKANIGAFGYLRVSGKGQLAGDGFPRQQAAITAYAKATALRLSNGSKSAP